MDSCINCKSVYHTLRECLNMTNRKPNTCSNCGKNGHRMKNCPTIICRKCERRGHITVDCPIKGGCHNCGKRSHSSYFCPKVKCYTCKKYGHTARKCTKGVTNNESLENNGESSRNTPEKMEDIQ